MDKNGVGSKFKMNIHIDGLGNETNATDSSVGVKVSFFTKHPDDDEYTAWECSKSSANNDKKLYAAETPGNDFACLVDTTNLGYGQLYAQVEVSYTDSQVGTLVEKKVYETDIILVKTL